jgi:hypothetical protein
VGLLLTQSGPLFWRQTGMVLEPGACAAFIAQLNQASVHANATVIWPSG